MSFVARLLGGGRLVQPSPVLLSQFRSVPQTSLRAGFQTGATPRIPLLRFASTVGGEGEKDLGNEQEENPDISEFALRVIKGGSPKDDQSALEEEMDFKRRHFHYEERRLTRQEKRDLDRETRMREMENDDNLSREEYDEFQAEPWAPNDKFLEERLRGEKLHRKDGKLHFDENTNDIGPAQYPTRHITRNISLVEAELFSESQKEAKNYEAMSERERDEAVLRHVELNKEGLRKGLVDLVHTMLPLTGRSPTHRASAGEEEKLVVEAKTMQEWVEGVSRLFHAQMYGPTRVDDKRAVMRVARAMKHVLFEDAGAKEMERVKRNEGTLARKGRLPSTQADLEYGYSEDDDVDIVRERELRASQMMRKMKGDSGDLDLDEVLGYDHDLSGGDEKDILGDEALEKELERLSLGEDLGEKGEERLKMMEEEYLEKEGEGERLADVFQREKGDLEERDLMISLLDSVADPQPESDVQFQNQKAKSRLTDLKYFHLYPKPAQQWVIDAKTPIGFYDDRGYWSPMEVTERLLRHSRQKMRESADRYLQLRLRQGIGEGAYPVFPEDLKGHYRFGLTPEEVASMDFEEKTHRVLSFAYATQREINKFRVQQAIKKFGRFPGDTGSDEAQFAALTEKVFALTEHFRANHKDYAKKRHFGRLLARRQKVMNRLKFNQTLTYYEIIKEFKIPDTGKTWKMNRTGGIQIPKKCRMSKQKRARLVKGKSISQKSFALAAAKKGTRK